MIKSNVWYVVGGHKVYKEKSRTRKTYMSGFVLSLGFKILRPLSFQGLYLSSFGHKKQRKNHQCWVLKFKVKQQVFF